jgi:hypothetical protein
MYSVSKNEGLILLIISELLATGSESFGPL